MAFGGLRFVHTKARKKDVTSTKREACGGTNKGNEGNLPYSHQLLLKPHGRFLCRNRFFVRQAKGSVRGWMMEVLEEFCSKSFLEQRMRS